MVGGWVLIMQIPGSVSNLGSQEGGSSRHISVGSDEVVQGQHLDRLG